MHLPMILKLCLVLIQALKGDEAAWGEGSVGWNRSPPYTILCGFIFFCSFSYSQPQFENVTWNVLEINNSQVFISFHFSFWDKSLTVAQTDFKLLPQTPDFGVMVVCHQIWSVNKFIIIFYNTLLLIVVFHC